MRRETKIMRWKYRAKYKDLFINKQKNKPILRLFGFAVSDVVHIRFLLLFVLVHVPHFFPPVFNRVLAFPQMWIGKCTQFHRAIQTIVYAYVYFILITRWFTLTTILFSRSHKQMLFDVCKLALYEKCVNWMVNGFAPCEKSARLHMKCYACRVKCSFNVISVCINSSKKNRKVAK